MAQVAQHDPGNAHGIIYMWGTNGIGYNEKMVKALHAGCAARQLAAGVRSGGRLEGRQVRHQRARFAGRDDARGAQLSRAGIRIRRSPRIWPPPRRRSLKIRPYIRNINSSEYIEALANGDLCVAVGYNGDVLQARDRAREANKGIEIKYVVPKEGSILWFDMLAIPKDAPHPDSAYAYHELHHDAARSSPTSPISSATPTRTLAAQPLVQPMRCKNDPGIYPPPESARRSSRCSWRIRPTRRAPSPASGKNSRRANSAWPTPAEPSKPLPGRIPSARPYVRDRARHQVLRRFQGGRRCQPQDLQGRDFLPARRIGLRQDHAAAHARRLRDAELRPDLHRRRGHDRRAAVRAAGQHDVPVLRAVSRT